MFFGEGVPRDRVERAFRGVQDADAMLVVGSSLMVYSGYRFAQAAADAGKPIAAVNLGRTRADHLLALKVSQSCSEALASAVGAGLASRIRRFELSTIRRPCPLDALIGLLPDLVMLMRRDGRIVAAGGGHAVPELRPAAGGRARRRARLVRRHAHARHPARTP